MITKAIDVGGSQTRAKNVDGSAAVIFDSITMQIPVEAHSKPYIADKRADFVINACPRTTIVGHRYAKGEAMAHYQGQVLSVDNQSMKVLQDPTYINIVYALACDALDHHEDPVNFKCGICIPVAEFYGGDIQYSEVLKTNVVGTYSVGFPMLNRTVNFTVEEVRVFPEGFITLLTFNGEPMVTRGVSLIVDVGYRSTDITIARKLRPSGKSARSVPLGGINVEACLIGLLERSNILIDRSEAKSIITSGVYQSGKDTIDCSSYVYSAFETFATQLANSIIDALAFENTNIKSITAVLPIGRPFTAHEKWDLASMMLSRLNCSAKVLTVSSLGTANVDGITVALSKIDT